MDPSLIAVLVGTEQNIFPFSINYFNAIVPVAQQAGQEAVLGRLSLSVCLRLEPNFFLYMHCRVGCSAFGKFDNCLYI
jgi:hypothetical protein